MNRNIYYALTIIFSIVFLNGYSQSCVVSGFSSSSTIDTDHDNVIDATLTWTGIGEAEEYQVSYTATGVSSTNLNSTTGTTQELKSLIANTTYYWRVRVKCNGQWSAWPTTYQSFVTPNGASCWVSGFAATPFVNSANGNSIDATLSWNSVSIGEEYQVNYSTPGAGGVTLDPTDEPIQDLSNLIANATYYWRVRVKCNGTWATWPATYQTFVTPAGESCWVTSGFTATPFINASNGNSIDANLSWDEVPIGEAYQLNYSAAGLASTTLPITTSPNAVLTNLKANTTYYWRVLVKCNGQWSPWPTTYQTFVTPAGESCWVTSGFNAITSINTANGNAIDATLSWDVVNIAEEYQVNYYSPGAESISTITLTSPTVVLNNLIANANYSWRVRVKCNGEWSPWPTTYQTFVTPAGESCWLTSGFSATTSINSANGNAIDATLSWDAPSLGSEYQVSYYAVGVGSVALPSVGNSITLTNLIANTTYYWRVRLKCNGQWSPWPSIYQTFVTPAGESCWVESGFNATPFIDNSDGSIDAILSWDGATIGSEYQVNYYREGGSSVSTPTTTETTVTLANLVANSTYYYRIRLKCNGQWSPWPTTYKSFQTMDNLLCWANNFSSTPFINTGNGNSIDATLSWGGAAIAESYQINYYADGINSTTLQPTSLTNDVLTNLLPITTYYWRVRVKCNGQWSPLSTTYQSFTTPDNSAPSPVVIPQDNWSFEYRYDTRKRMTKKKVPGADWVYMVYDDRDRLVLTQDGNQRSSNQWTFTKYDELNRPILTGTYTHSVSVDQAGMQDAVDDFYNPNINPDNKFFEVRGSAIHGYTNQSFPNTVTNEADYLTVTYYDDYDFSKPQSFDYDENQLTSLGQEPEEFTRVKGQVTGTKVKNLDDNSWLWTVNYYDDRYRFIQSVSQNHRGGVDRITNVNDFVGKVLHTKTTHSIAAGEETSIARSFGYDHAGRLLETTHETNGTSVTLTENKYNELGQLDTKNLHKASGETDFRQQVDYRYNIRGWLTRINNSDLNTTEDGGPSDYFGMELAYNDFMPGVTSTPEQLQYNGNISAIKWSTNQGFGFENQTLGIVKPKELAYGFTYDKMNRLKGAAYHQFIGTGWNPSSAFHEDNINYDLNGNILDLRRTTTNGALMDLLEYHYGEGTSNHSNKLLSVADGATGDDAAKGFTDGNTSGSDYNYDPNGNMIEDKNKDITSIEYNHLNLPKKVTKGTGEYIEYIYDATGRKLSQEVYTASNALEKKSDYLGEFFYENDELKFINHEEGRIIPQEGSMEYQYHMKDHLGNVRLTFTTKEDAELNLATLETENADDERTQFLYYDEAVKINSFLFDHTHRVSGGGSGPNVPVTGVSLSGSGMTMKVGQTTAVNETVAPANASNKNVTWTSSNTSVATVNANGDVTAVSIGTSTITVTTVDGNFTASLLVTVEASNNKIKNFEFDQALSDWIVYDWATGGSTGSVVQGSGLSGENAAFVNIASTDNSGWKIQLRQGLDWRLEVGHTYQISFVAKAESSRIIKAAFQGAPSNTEYWSSGTVNITTTAQTYGPFQYTCNNANVDNESSFAFKFYLAYGVNSDVWIDKVIVTDMTQGGPVTDILLAPETLSLTMGQTGQLTKTILPSNATNQNVTWTSSDESVATVNSAGLVTSVSPGTATITVTTQDGGYTATSNVTVKPVGTNLLLNNEFDEGLSNWNFSDWTSAGGNSASIVENAGLSGEKAVRVDIANADNGDWTIGLSQSLSGTIEVGKTYEISFMAKAESPRDAKMVISGRPSNGAYWQKTVTLTTQPQVFGPYQFTCTNNGGEQTFYTSFLLAKGVISDVWIDRVIINDISEGVGVVSGVSITPELSLTTGQSEQLVKTIMPSNAANKNVNWSSSNTSVATVNSEGVVTTHSPGGATITAITEDGGFSSRCILAVSPSGSNTLTNNEFDDGLNNWVLYDWTGPNNSNGGNTVSVVQGAGLSGANSAYINVVNNNSSGWTLQLRQFLPFDLKQGRTYEVSFMAKAETTRTMRVLLDEESGPAFWYSDVNLTTTPQTFTFQYTCNAAPVTSNPAFMLLFYFANGVISDVWLDKVTVRDLSSGGTSPVIHYQEAENYISQSGMYVSDGALNSCDAEDWARYNGVNLTGVKELRATFASNKSEGKMEMRLGSTTGTLIATLPAVNTGGWSTYKEFTVPITETTGIHDIYIVFKDVTTGVMNLDRIQFLGESIPSETTNALHQEAESYVSQSGMYVSSGALNSCDAEDWARYNGIDLSGVKELRARFASNKSTGKMEMRLGSTTGTLIATLPAVNTGGWSTFREFAVPITETTGIHDVYIVFKDVTSGVMNLDWMEFVRESTPIVVTDVSVSPNSPTVYKGQTIRLTKSITPTDASNQNVTWTSSNTNIATVNANGDVTGIEVGTATITATTEDGNLTDAITVTVAESTAGTFYSTRLSGSPTERYGLAKSLSVMPGDVVKMEVFAKYLDPNDENWTALLNNLIISLSVPSGGTFIDGGGAGSLGGETYPFTPINHTAENGGEAPKAYLNYILMDRDFNQILDMGYRRVTTAALEQGANGEHERLFFDDITVKEPGYMYIYLSNEGEELVDVFFDDFKVEHIKSPVIQVDDYYPFGLTFNSYKKENSTLNPYQYNGKELQDELDLGWLDYGARMYMPEIGRWRSIDPLSAMVVKLSPYNYVNCNPVRFSDPTGMFSQDEIDKWVEEKNAEWTKWEGGASFSEVKGVGSYFTFTEQTSDDEKTTRTIGMAYLTALQKNAEVQAKNFFIKNILQTNDFEDINVYVDVEFDENVLRDFIGSNIHRGSITFELNTKEIKSGYYFSNTKEEWGRRIFELRLPTDLEGSMSGAKGYFIHFFGRSKRELGNLSFSKEDQIYVRQQHSRYLNYHYIQWLKTAVNDKVLGKWALGEIDRRKSDSSNQFRFRIIKTK